MNVYMYHAAICQDDFARKERVAKLVAEGTAKNFAQVCATQLVTQLVDVGKSLTMTIVAGLGVLCSHELRCIDRTSSQDRSDGRGGDCGRVPRISAQTAKRSYERYWRSYWQHRIKIVARN